MTAETPVFSVIMATWGRGRHILPSIQSVLGQDLTNFELIVVGDACNDETGDVVAGLSDPRVRWINLANRCGSQSAPNNAGIAAAQGAFIAYLGHDDIWEMGHLAELARVFGRSDAPDFAVSGLIAHLPQGVPGSAVMGLFSDDRAKHRYFFPPSCFAHRKSVIDRIGPWLMPMEVRAPVDADLLLRASAADLRFASTGVVTVHKFTAMLRYLSYLQPASDEQEAMLADLSAPDHAARMAAIVDTSRRMGRFMLEARESHDHLQPGELARISAARRGVTMAARPLGAGTVIRQREENCWLDWQIKPRFGIRYQSRNPRPRFALPFTAEGPISLTIRVVHPDQRAFGPLWMLCNGERVTAQPTGLAPGLWGWTALYRAEIRLRPDRPSVLEFLLDPLQVQKGRHFLTKSGFGIGKLWLRPLAR